MKLVVPFLFLLGLFAVRRGQENSSANQSAAPSVGIQVGEQAPQFALPDQFGHQQSNQTLKGSNGTVILFFRSADW